MTEADRCCHAVQDKVWVDAPDVPFGAWNFYTVLADDPDQAETASRAPAAPSRRPRPARSRTVRGERMSTLNVMNRILEVAGTAGREQRLPRGAFAEVAFTPAAGAIAASAGVVADPLGKVDPNPDEDGVDGPFDPDFVEPGNLEVSIHAPAGRSWRRVPVGHRGSGSRCQRAWRAGYGGPG